MLPYDHYIRNPGALNGKPKETIGRYVASHGFPVPFIYEDHKDAILHGLKHGKKVDMRSEHFLEYKFLRTGMGYSDLSRSHDLETMPASGPVIDDAFLDPRIPGTGFLDLDFQQLREEYAKQVQYSYWEHIPGTIAFIVADSGVPERVHVHLKNGRDFAYVRADGGRHEIKHTHFSIDGKRIDEALELYAAVGALDNFDPKNCSLQEMVIPFDHRPVNFLQYLRTQDRFYNSFSLDKLKKSGARKAYWVRGATADKGFRFTIPSAFFKDSTYAYSEWDILLRAHDTVYLHNSSGLEHGLLNHQNLSRFFKPKISANFDLHRWVDRKSQRPVEFQLFSNGHEAYVIGPNEPNPFSNRQRRLRCHRKR